WASQPTISRFWDRITEETIKGFQKLNQALIDQARLAEEFILNDDNHPWEEKEVYFCSVPYQAASWSKPRRVCIRSTREAGELLFSHAFIVTSFSENISPERVFETYKKRGTMEN